MFTKQKILILLLALTASSGLMSAANSIGKFSVSATQQVTFSPGNLQYNAALGTHQCADGKTLQGTWRFAEHQWDYVGEDNKNISSTYDGWIDLFGFGTSGWDSGATEYQPWSTSQTNSDYYTGGSYENDLTGNYANADWGVYNQIGNDAPGTWRTLTCDEWVYLFHDRSNAENLFGLGTVNGVPGAIILPDGWQAPSGVTFIASAENGLSWQGSCYYQSGSNHYNDNVFVSGPSGTWDAMATSGAVFLPASGTRFTTAYSNNTTSFGLYWSSSTTFYGTHAYYLNFNTSQVYLRHNYDERSSGFAVRLVSDLTTSSDPEPCILASGTCSAQGDNLTWELSCDGVLTISGTGAMADYDYSEETRAPWYDSYRTKIVTVVIEEGITSIGDYAFNDCENLTAITIPNTLNSIGESAFHYCLSLGDINVPRSVSLIKRGAFRHCPEINISVDEDNQYYTIENGVLFNKEKTLLHTYPMSKHEATYSIPNTVTAIEDLAFNYADITSVDIPEGVLSIGVMSFYVCYKLTSITIPNSVTTIGGEAFYSAQQAKFLHLGQGLTSIGQRAFCDMRDIEYIISEAPTPPVLLDNDAFVSVDKSIPLFVPCEAKEAYKEADGWKEFTNVQAIPSQEPCGDSNNNGIGIFSVSATQKVTFSPGNLQYNAAAGTHQCADGTTQQGTWRFAEHQWDIVGMGYGQKDVNDPYQCYVAGTVENSDNRQRSSTYNGWIDLFGWGTSGWNSGANAYQPYSTSASYSDYWPGGNELNSLTGAYANADWGVYNQIENDAPGIWRTLTGDEWEYLFTARTDAEKKYGAAIVNGVTGIIVLPDEWKMPLGCSFKSGMTNAHSPYDWSLVATTNIYTTEQWQLMETEGAVFLPAAGHFGGAAVMGTGRYGLYWSSTKEEAYSAHTLAINSDGIGAKGNYGHNCGFSVRLVQVHQAIQKPIYTLTISVKGEGEVTGAGEYKSGDIATLTATPASGYTFSQWSDGNTDNPRDVIVTGDATFTAVFEKKELSSDITLQENESADYYTQFANDYNGHTVTTATLNRQFTQGKWATLCLPFNVNKAMMMSLGLYNRVFAFRYAQQLDDETIQVFFTPAQSIEAGKGYIVNPNAKLAAKTSFVFPNVTINTDSDNGDITALTGYNDGTGRGNLFLVGTLRTGILQGSTTGNTYLGLKDNQLYYPNTTSGTLMRAYRAVFRSDIPVNASRVRIIAEGESVTELEVMNGEEDLQETPPARKYLRNGLLFIERNGITYTAQGHRID